MSTVDAKFFHKHKWIPKLLPLLHHEKTPVAYSEHPKIVEIIKHVPVIQKVEVIKPVEIIKTVQVPGNEFLRIFLLDYVFHDDFRSQLRSSKKSKSLNMFQLFKKSSKKLKLSEVSVHT